MLKNILIKSLTLIFIIGLAGCEKDRGVDTEETKQTTSPHALDNPPVTASPSIENNLTHDDFRDESSAPTLTETPSSK